MCIRDSLLRMGGAGDDPQPVIRQVVAGVEVFDDGGVVVWHDALDGRYDEFAVERGREGFEKFLEIGRGGGQDEDVGFADHLVQIARGGDARGVELRVAQVAGVAPPGAERLQHLRIADVPAHARFVFAEHLDDGRSPAAVADDRAAGTFSDRIFHVCRS